MNSSANETPNDSQSLSKTLYTNSSAINFTTSNQDFLLLIQAHDTTQKSFFFEEPPRAKLPDSIASNKRRPNIKIRPFLPESRAKIDTVKTQEVPSPEIPFARVPSGMEDEVEIYNKGMCSFMSKSFEIEPQREPFNDDKHLSFIEFQEATTPELKGNKIMRKAKKRRAVNESPNWSFASPTKLLNNTTIGETQESITKLDLKVRRSSHDEKALSPKENLGISLNFSLTRDLQQNEVEEKNPSSVIEFLGVRRLSIPDNASRRFLQPLSPVNENDAEHFDQNQNGGDTLRHLNDNRIQESSSPTSNLGGTMDIISNTERALVAARASVDLENNSNYGSIQNPDNQEDQGNNQIIQEPIAVAAAAPLPIPLETMLTEGEGNKYLWRWCAFFVGVGLELTLAVLIVKELLTFDWIFVGLYLYLGCSVFEVLINLCAERFTSKPWRRREDAFLLFDSLSAAFWVISIDQKIRGNLSICTVGSIPSLIMTVLYLLYSSAPSSIKAKRGLVVLFFAIQSVLIGVKLDGYLDINWDYALGALWVYCLIGACYCVVFGLILVVLGLFILLKQHQTRSLKADFIGHLWLFVYYSGSLFIALGIYSLIRNEMNTFVMVTYIGIGISIFLAAYILIFQKALLKFVRVFKAANGNRVGEEQKAVQQFDTKIEVQKTSSYFIMQSSTYFRPLDNGFFKKNSEEIKKVKELLKKNWRKWISLSGMKKASENKKNEGKIEIEVLKNYKESLDKRFNQTETFSSSACKLKRKGPSNHLTVGSQEALESPREMSFCGKKQYSVDDKYALELAAEGEIEYKIGVNDEESELCYLCFENAPNAILLNCGHGGICYECGIIIVKKNNECMECRKEISSIYKVDPKNRKRNIIHGIEISKITRTALPPAAS